MRPLACHSALPTPSAIVIARLQGTYPKIRVCGFRRTLNDLALSVGAIEKGDRPFAWFPYRPHAYYVTEGRVVKRVMHAIVIEHARPLPPKKMQAYADLWFEIDSIGGLELRLHLFDRDGGEREADLHGWHWGRNCWLGRAA